MFGQFGSFVKVLSNSSSAVNLFRTFSPLYQGSLIITHRDRSHSRALNDARRRFEWRDEFPPIAESSPELKEKPLEKFGWILDKI